MLRKNKNIQQNAEVARMLNILRSKLMLFLLCLGLSIPNLSAQTSTVTGTITDDLGDPLIGVTIAVKNTTTGTSTDIDGTYSLDVSSSDTLIISYVGYATQEIIVGNQSVINVVMTTDAELLEEIVVTGYGTQKKSHVTGSISKVTNENLDQIAVARVDDALIGQVSGVNIQATSAEAGGAPTITIRGFGSINAEAGPAVVVDGIVVDPDFLSNLDMNDIASFEVLKDAASAAIYGSEGSNGVIMVTTKDGEAGKTKFSYQSYIGRKDAFESEDYKKSVAEWAAFELADAGELSNTTLYAQDLVSRTGVDRDWQEVFFNGGTIQSHSFSARGGSQKTKFSTSLRYLHDEGVVITDDYKLYSINLKMDTEISDKFKFGIRATPSYSERRRLPTSIHNPIRQSPWLLIYHTEETIEFVDRNRYPNVAVGDYFREDHLKEIDYTGDGSDSRPRTSGDQNPYAQYVEREHFEYKTKVLGSTFLQYKILDGLTAKTSLGITLEQRKRTRYDGRLHHANPGRAQYNLQNRVRTRIISDNTIDYKQTFGAHELSALVGATFQKRQTENSVIEGTGYANDLLKNLQGATNVSEFEEINAEKNKIGYFVRVNYVFANKYLVNASYRRDASSVFGIDSKWGDFPSISIGWNAHNEDFLANNSLISRLKLRVSYGETGNENFSVGDDIINAWPYLALLNTSNAVSNDGITAGISARNIANTLLQWEASQEFNPGIDFGFLDNRITGSLDFYRRTSDNLLLNNPVSYITGFNAGIVNLGEVKNQGFELELRTRNISTKDLKWNTTLIASTNKNELLDFGESNGQLSEDTFGRNSQWINSVGNPISSFYGYVVDRELDNQYWTSPYIPINGTAEDVIVKDLNGDGLITDADKTILGDPYPEFIWSLTNQLQVGKFDFQVMIQGSLGAQVKNIGDQYFETHWTGRTISDEAVVDAGIITDPSFLQAKVLTDDVVQSANYFSLRNVNIGYTFSNDQLSRLGLEGLRIYATGQNLIYQTSDEYNGFNPEYIDTGNTPTSYGSQRAGTPLFRTFTFGLNVDF